MFRSLLLAVGLAMLAACAQTHGASRPEPAASLPASSPELLNRLAGAWVLRGEIAGQNTTHDVRAAPVLQGNYVRIDEVSREAGENGLPAYEATIFVGWLDERYVCIWLDNTGVAAPGVTCEATPHGDAIPFEFRNAQGALIFTNTFTYNRSDDTWEWRMVNIGGNGAEDTFGIVTLSRR